MAEISELIHLSLLRCLCH